MGSTSSVSGSARFWDRQLLDQHGTDAEQPIGAQRVEPRVAVGDVGRETPERAHLAGAGQGRARDQVHQHLARALIQPENRHPLPRAQLERLDAQRSQPPIVLRDVAQLQERLTGCGHGLGRAG